ncbi:ATP-dependent DNA helicase RecQ [Clostridia bacterium]|nr:ATP-dependent DNA helicase RecQ [Clostridia bacterium]
MSSATEILRQYYGYSEFRQGQSETIAAILGGRDCLAVMPTGAGKSLCYQVPALLFDGVTLVVSPLISLMRDQVMALKENGVAAAYINSSLTARQSELALERARNGAYKIIYVAPERLDTASFVGFAQHTNIAFIAVDEAHCISHWGNDFRPSYLNIANFVDSLPRRPVVAAFTATATREVKDDIAVQLGLREPFTLTTGFNRENLYFEVQKPKSKDSALLAFMRGHADKSGIVYCSTRKAVEEVCDLLCQHSYSATRYHAGLPQEERAANQEEFLYDRRTIMVATNAFGMGIDKSNVSFVVHYNMPKNLESYYQEAGRAGRDGSPADCVLLYSGKDVEINKFFIEDSEDEASKQRERDRLRQMTFYSTTQKCLRRFILDYFGDRTVVKCDNCSNCKAKVHEVDITTQTRHILSCIAEMNQRFGVSLLVDVLRGSKSERVLKFKMDKFPSYGVLRKESQSEVREIVDFLVQEGYIEVTNSEYPVAKLTELSKSVERVTMKRRELPVVSEKKADVPVSYAESYILLARLKALRLEIAREQDVPAFVIFSDATLTDMCAKKPRTDEEFLRVSGVGRVKLERYGARFLEVLRS